MRHYKISPSKMSGSIKASPSKSHSLRAILFASLASGTSIIRHYLKSPDVDAMINACEKLGATITRYDDFLEIVGVSGKPSIPDDVIDAGNSGQVLRFVGAIAALTQGHVVLTGDHSVRFNRPIKPLMEGLSQLGAHCISTKNDDYAPVIIKGPIISGVTTLDGQDSQPVSALLIVAAFLDGITEIRVRNPGEKPWVGLTLDWFDRLGVEYTNENFEKYTVKGKHCINAFEYSVPGDFSSIAYPVVAALITESEVVINNVDMNDSQGDKKMIDALVKMGADINVSDDTLHIKPNGQLRGCEVDVNDFIDAVTILAVVGCYASGTTTLTNATIARKKESDRLTTITKELKKMGANITEREDGLVINNSVLSGAECDSHNDHRIAMSCAVAALAATSDSQINNVGCVDKSYTHFVSDMKSLGCDVAVMT